MARVGPGGEGPGAAVRTTTFVRREYIENDMQVIKKRAKNSPRSYPMLLALGLGPSEIRTRLTAEFGALGVVCALLASLSFTVLSSPPGRIKDSYAANSAYCIVSSASLLCNLACIALSTYMVSEINILNDELTPWFVNKYVETSTLVNYQFFNAGFGLLVSSLGLYVVFTYPAPAAYASVAVAVMLGAIVVVIWQVAARKRYWRLQEFYQEMQDAQQSRDIAAGGVDDRKGCIRCTNRIVAAIQAQ